jgi:hypothetical protein
MGKGLIIMPHAVHSQVKVGKHNVERRRFWPPGSRLEGQFFENQLVGHGILTKPNGERMVVRENEGKLVRM